MKKKTLFGLYAIIGLFLACNFFTPACAQEVEEDDNFYYTCFVRENLTEEANQLNEFIAKYIKTIKNHEVDELKNIYAVDYISGDGFKRDKTIEVLKESWDLSPDLSYSAEIQNIKFDKNFATVEISENLFGLTKESSDITEDQGFIESSSRIILQLQKYGKGWKIITDQPLYEETSIKYGAAKDVDANIFSPDQVFPGNKYTISLETDIPDDMFAIGSISNEPLVYPRSKPEEIFKQVPLDIKLLERVVSSNDSAVNELAIASISYCKVKQDTLKKPDIELAGTAILIKRVNVVNKAVSK